MQSVVIKKKNTKRKYIGTFTQSSLVKFVFDVFFHQSYLPCNFKLYRNLLLKQLPIECSEWLFRREYVSFRGLSLDAFHCAPVSFTNEWPYHLVDCLSTTSRNPIFNYIVVYSSIFCLLRLEHYVLELTFLHQQRQMEMFYFF